MRARRALRWARVRGRVRRQRLGGGRRRGARHTGRSAAGGAQDFGAFRTLIDQGKIPGPNTLDSVGFFNEHKIELPAPDCGHDVCAHGLLGVMGNLINGANCTMVMIGLNTPDRPERSSSGRRSTWRSPSTPAARWRASRSRACAKGSTRMLAALEPEDRVSLVAFSDSAQVVPQGDGRRLPRVCRRRSTGCRRRAATNLYDGLRSAYDLVERSLDRERQNRVILLSDGVATAGVQESRADRGARPRLCRSRRRRVDDRRSARSSTEPLLRSLAEAGGGHVPLRRNLAAVREIFTEEVNLTIVPIAERARARSRA